MSDSPKLDELRKLVAELRSLGVTHYRSGEIELELGPEPLPDRPREGIADRDELRKRLEEEDEELQFAATEGFSS